MKAPTEVSNVTGLSQRFTETERESSTAQEEGRKTRKNARRRNARRGEDGEREKSRDRQKRKFLVWRWQVERMRMQGVRVCRRPM
jgi:hypothetical protein